jgi:hypothetical protein
MIAYRGRRAHSREVVLLRRCMPPAVECRPPSEPGQFRYCGIEPLPNVFSVAPMLQHLGYEPEIRVKHVEQRSPAVFIVHVATHRYKPVYFVHQARTHLLPMRSIE